MTFVGVCVYQEAKFSPEKRGIAIGYSKNNIWRIVTQDFTVLFTMPYFFEILNDEVALLVDLT